MTRKGRSRQQQIYDVLKREIQRNTYKPGDYLPTVRELAKRFETSITPVYQAVNSLASEGYLSLTQGSGIMMLGPEEGVGNRRKPMIDFLGTTRHFSQNEPPQISRLTTAAADWLLWGLSHSKEVRVSVTHFPFQDDQDFYEALTDSLHSDSEIITFSDPEKLDAEAMRLLSQIHKAGKRIVYLANMVDVPEFDRVRSDFRNGSYALTWHLLEQGHTCLLRFHTSLDNWYETQKEEGFQAAIKDWNQTHSANVVGLRHLSFDENLGVAGIKEEAWSLNELRSIVEQHPVTALLATSDPSVLYLRHAASALGREDLEITGYDLIWSELAQVSGHSEFIKKHSDAVRYSEPPISVEVNAPLLGSELAKLAIQRAMGTVPSKPQVVLVPQKLHTKPELQKLNRIV
ncbi:GntR family transcriptional regulator [Rubellicoccus peritrichatus]|uniref:GntR family transcriptional regulator n=1 Tax=Rubellicoccus peritrichatus TaxID=3080537 RepID=A0AAQ3L527_9BACT|nr:GntR family transcriptional regulator [Puniceicoccus sp. CR14]WOO39539.1 GntR family transcriptional regulator [Puniceicoccus sp. CR14]